mmetsp:Transcript_7719/g.11387  ORF Transcript_7719/g.11387 Transcript_7719/m.11387 type:complete len:429 (-) Transcript_7719:106-1392(-)
MCDLLEELNIPLPEQQTSTDDLLIVKALEANPNICLGFDACLNCAKSLSKSSKTCRQCGRVSYCSSKCRDDDSKKGHGAVVCSLLKLCNEDEAEEELDEKEGSRGNGSTSTTRIEASQYRVQSERESYPATLANIIMDGPVYQKVLHTCANKAKSLTIHIVGASDAELWEYGSPNVYEAYSEALTELAETHKISRINLVFVGPECRSVVKEVGVKFDGSGEDNNKCGGSCRILFEGLKDNYEDLFKSRSKRSAADIVVLFNPGFTCQDYNWKFALRCIKTGTPIVVTTNTEMEAIMDAQYLLDQRFIKNLPKMIAEMVRAEDDENDDGEHDFSNDSAENDDEGMFFGENPYAGSRVRQSGTMGNDLYIKSKWMFGGLFCKKSSSNEAAEASVGKKRDARDSVGASTTNAGPQSVENKPKKQKGNYALI